MQWEHSAHIRAKCVQPNTSTPVTALSGNISAQSVTQAVRHTEGSQSGVHLSERRVTARHGWSGGSCLNHLTRCRVRSDGLSVLAVCRDRQGSLRRDLCRLGGWEGVEASGEEVGVGKDTVDVVGVVVDATRGSTTFSCGDEFSNLLKFRNEECLSSMLIFLSTGS